MLQNRITAKAHRFNSPRIGIVIDAAVLVCGDGFLADAEMSIVTKNNSDKIMLNVRRCMYSKPTAELHTLCAISN